MPVTVRFFAALREQVGAGEAQLEIKAPVAAAEVWRQIVGEPAGADVLVAINKQYASVDTQVADGDEVAFFPPVTGG